MLELKRLPFEEVNVLPGMQRVHLRLARFRGGTVPAIRLNGQRVQGSRQIARALDKLEPEPALFPADPAQRRAVEEAERWGEQEFQDVPRIVLRWGLVEDLALRRWVAAQSNMPMADLSAHLSGPLARYYARVIGADEPAARRAMRELPQMLDHADELLAEGTLALDPPNAATLQVLSTVRALSEFEDLRDQVAAHPVASAAQEFFPQFPGPVPGFI